MATIYIVAGINHFWHPHFYLRLMPPYLPAPHLLQYLSGVIEIVLGVLLLVKAARPLAAWSLAILLLLFMMVHIYMLQQALHRPDYLMSPRAAWLRLALQPVLIVWALWYTKPL